METLFKQVFEKNSVSFYEKVENQTSTDVDKPNEPDFLSFQQHISHKNDILKYLNTITNDQKIVESNFTNPMCSIDIKKCSIIIDSNDEKVSLKIFTYNKIRPLGGKYFKFSNQMFFVTYNKKRKEIFYGVLTNRHKKRKKTSHIRRNIFIQNYFERMFTIVNEMLTTHSEHYNIDKNVILDEIKNIIYKEVGYKFNHEQTLNNFIYQKYLENKGVKYPNNFEIFQNVRPLITKKEFKKAKFKMVDAVMNRYNLRGDKFRKILHEIKHINTYSLPSVLNFFGVDFLINKDETILKKIISNNFLFFHFINYTNFSLTKKEKDNCFNIFSLVLDNLIQINSFLDHIRFYSELQKYEPVKWKSNDIKSFFNEHIDWSEKYTSVKNATYERKYDVGFINIIENGFEYLNNTYYPVILKKSEEYNEESLIQSNCVRGYIDRASSLIISLRKNSKESEERLTIEYLIKKSESNKIKLLRIQTRSRFNGEIDDDWFIPLEILDENITNYSKLLKNIEIIKTTKYGVENIQGIFNDENSNLVWDLDDNILNLI